MEFSLAPSKQQEPKERILFCHLDYGDTKNPEDGVLYLPGRDECILVGQLYQGKNNTYFVGFKFNPSDGKCESTELFVIPLGKEPIKNNFVRLNYLVNSLRNYSDLLSQVCREFYGDCFNRKSLNKRIAKFNKDLYELYEKYLLLKIKGCLKFYYEQFGNGSFDLEEIFQYLEKFFNEAGSKPSNFGFKRRTFEREDPREVKRVFLYLLQYVKLSLLLCALSNNPEKFFSKKNAELILNVLNVLIEENSSKTKSDNSELISSLLNEIERLENRL